MTKIIAILSATLLAILGLSFTATTEAPVEVETTEEVYEIIGTVQEITEGYIMIEDAQGQQVQVNTSGETLYEGETPAEGDLIHILYNGMMTRSLPPQISAIRIGCYVRTGAVVELTQEGFTLDAGEEIIQVNAEAALLEGIETGSTVKVYFNGAMTMSLPAQIGAELILPVVAE